MQTNKLITYSSQIQKIVRNLLSSVIRLVDGRHASSIMDVKVVDCDSGHQIELILTENIEVRKYTWCKAKEV